MNEASTPSIFDQLNENPVVQKNIAEGVRTKIHEGEFDNTKNPTLSKAQTEVLNAAGITLALSTDYKGGRECLDKALVINPDNIKILQNSVGLYSNYEHLIQQEHKNDIYSKYGNEEKDPYNYDSCSFIQKEDLEQLLSRVEKILKLLPEDETQEREKYEKLKNYFQEMIENKKEKVVIEDDAYQYRKTHE